MANTLVTVFGPSGPRDLELPADVPLGQVIPLLLQECVPQVVGTAWANPAYWGLGPLAGQPLPLEMSLNDARVLDGAGLVFQDMESWRGPAPVAAPVAAAAPASESGQAGPIGIRWNRDGLLT